MAHALGPIGTFVRLRRVSQLYSIAIGRTVSQARSSLRDPPGANRREAYAGDATGRHRGQWLSSRNEAVFRRHGKAVSLRGFQRVFLLRLPWQAALSHLSGMREGGGRLGLPASPRALTDLWIS